jgi:heat shock protein HtpX
MLGAVGLRTHAWNTAIRSILLLAGFPFLLAMMGYAIALFLVASDAPTIAKGLAQAAQLLPFVIGVALVVAAIWFAIAWRWHNSILDAVTGARPVAEPFENPRLWNMTEELCISRGMPMPRLAVIDTDDRNAFATGLTPAKAGVTVTRGLMEALDDRELRAVIGHELAHIRNGDARLGVIAAVFVGVITLVTDLVWNMMKSGDGVRVRLPRRSSSSSSSSSNRNGGGAGVMLALIAIAVVIAIAAHMLALVLRMALSRNREYLADAGAVELTADPDAMISALRKVAQKPGLAAVPDQVRAMFLHDAKLSGAIGWFATHPPIEKRVAALVQFAGGRDPGPLPDLPPEPEVAPEPDPDATVVTRAPWQDPPISPPAEPSASAPQSPASSPPASPWRPSPWRPPGPG